MGRLSCAFTTKDVCVSVEAHWLLEMFIRLQSGFDEAEGSLYDSVIIIIMITLQIAATHECDTDFIIGWMVEARLDSAIIKVLSDCLLQMKQIEAFQVSLLAFIGSEPTEWLVSRCPILGAFPCEAVPPNGCPKCVLAGAGRENFSVRGYTKGPTGPFLLLKEPLFSSDLIAKAIWRPCPFICVCLCKYVCFPESHNGLFIPLYETCCVGSGRI